MALTKNSEAGNVLNGALHELGNSIVALVQASKAVQVCLRLWSLSKPYGLNPDSLTTLLTESELNVVSAIL